MFLIDEPSVPLDSLFCLLSLDGFYVTFPLNVVSFYWGASIEEFADAAPGTLGSIELS